MDRVRFGRALGMGARDAAKAMLKAADAATAPNPTPTRPSPITQAAAKTTAQTVHHVRTTSTGLKRGTKRFGEAIWGPFVKVSRVVMLEVTGVLFSLFAITAALEVWKHHTDLYTPGPPRKHLFFAFLMLATFTYFTVSSFVRASRRSHR